MPLGLEQNNSFANTTLDIWNDKVYYQEREFPAGYFSASILNISKDEIRELMLHAAASTYPLPVVMEGSESEAAEAFPILCEQIRQLADLILRYPPFCYNDREEELAKIDILFDESILPKVRDPNLAAHHLFLSYITSITRIPSAIWHFTTAGKYFEAGYLRRLKERTESSFAVAAHDCFNSKWFWDMMKGLPQPRVFQGKDVETFSMYPGIYSAYMIVRNVRNEKELLFANRINFPRFVDFYTYDLINGLHHGHAPSQCQGCGKYFLTTNRHRPKYCDGMAPQDSRLTCRQYGAMMQQKEKNKQHPIYQIFSTRTGTIRKHNQRGKISDELRQEAIHLAQQYRDKALMDNDYAANGYQRDMEQEHIYEEAKKRLK